METKKEPRDYMGFHVSLGECISCDLFACSSPALKLRNGVQCTCRTMQVSCVPSLPCKCSEAFHLVSMILQGPHVVPGQSNSQQPSCSCAMHSECQHKTWCDPRIPQKCPAFTSALTGLGPYSPNQVWALVPYLAPISFLQRK